MKKIELGQSFQILGNLGVIIGILLLVYELNQNRDLMVAQTRNSIAQSQAALIHNEALSEDMAGISRKAFAGKSLTPNEEGRFILNWTAYFGLWENIYFQYQNGLFSDEEYRARRQSWRRLFSEKPIRDLWCSRRTERAEQFNADINEFLGEDRCE